MSHLHTDNHPCMFSSCPTLRHKRGTCTRSRVYIRSRCFHAGMAHIGYILHVRILCTREQTIDHRCRIRPNRDRNGLCVLCRTYDAMMRCKPLTKIKWTVYVCLRIRSQFFLVNLEFDSFFDIAQMLRSCECGNVCKHGIVICRKVT